MGICFRRRIIRQSLSQQIKAAERDVLHQQRRVTVSTDHLVQCIHRQLTAPASLLMAGGVGFIMGELTRRQTTRTSSAGDQPQATGITRWQTALNLAGSVRALYTALPVAWLVRIYRQARSTNQATKPQPNLAAKQPVHRHRASRRLAGSR
jgi:hypothetical protein